MLCTSGEAGEPAQHPSGRLGDSRETEAVESGSGISRLCLAVDSGER